MIEEVKIIIIIAINKKEMTNQIIEENMIMMMLIEIKGKKGSNNKIANNKEEITIMIEI